MAVRLLGALVIALVIDVFALIDLWFIDRSRLRVFNKWVWAAIIVLVPVIGALLWFTVGRGRKGSARSKSVAPDDDPAFLRRLEEDRQREERLRRLEQELSDLDDDPGER